MVLPLAIDLDVAPRHALLTKTRLCKEISRWIVRRQACRFDSMQPQCPENKRHERANRVVHVALTGESLAHPIAESAGLRDAAAHIRQRAAPEECVVIRTEHEERISRIEARLALIALEATAVGTLGQFVGSPGRFPGGEKSAAFVA